MHRSATLALATALSGLAAAAAADPPQDPHTIATLQVENDAVSTRRGTTDEYYTSGLRIGLTLGTDATPAALSSIGQSLWGGNSVSRVSLNLSQSIYTPHNTQLSPPNPRDRPYAGWLRGDVQLITDKDTSRSVLGLSLGVVGSAALGEEVQNGFHDIIGDPSTKGWSSQLPNEPTIQLLAGRTWRVALGQIGGLETDALPAVELGVGSVRDYVQAGAVFRIGQGLGSDFGVPRIAPGFSGGDAYTPTRSFAWYVFAGGNGQGVLRDMFLDGGAFRDTPSSGVPGHRGLVGEAELGAAVMWGGVRVTYVQVFQSPTFNAQRAGLFNFGSLSASVRF